jgi:stage V sporulation protein R
MQACGFSRSNLLFNRAQSQISEHMLEHAANHARQIARAIEEYGAARVEVVLDAALALEQHIDTNHRLRREKYPEYLAVKPLHRDDEFAKRFAALDPELASQGAATPRQRAPTPPHLEKDLLWFIAQYAPELEGWERDIFLAVREESFYFYPVFATQIMNEGWASYWHARLLREADFMPQASYLDAIKCHSDVVRPYAADQNIALSINPYHLGFTMWEKIIERDGIEAARAIMQQDDDLASCAIYLDENLADELNLFKFNAEATAASSERSQAQRSA